jgi:hypothetical protein
MGDRHGQSNGLKIAQRVVGKRVTSAVRNVGAPVADDDRVAIGCCAGDSADAETAVRASDIFDDDAPVPEARSSGRA